MFIEHVKIIIRAAMIHFSTAYISQIIIMTYRYIGYDDIISEVEITCGHRSNSTHTLRYLL